MAFSLGRDPRSLSCLPSSSRPLALASQHWSNQVMMCLPWWRLKSFHMSHSSLRDRDRAILDSFMISVSSLSHSDCSTTVIHSFSLVCNCFSVVWLLCTCMSQTEAYLVCMGENPYITESNSALFIKIHWVFSGGRNKIISSFSSNVLCLE